MNHEDSDSEYSILQGQEAAKALNELIEEIDKGELEELTFRQAVTIEKIAKLLIAAIDQEDTTIWASLRHSGSLMKLRSTLKKLIEKMTESHPEPDDKPSVMQKEVFELGVRKHAQ